MATRAETQTPAAQPRYSKRTETTAAMPDEFLVGLRRRLTRRLAGLADGDPAEITIVGYDDRRSQILAQGDDAPETLLGFALPDRYRAVAAIAASVVATCNDGNIDAMLAIATTRQGQQMSFLRDRSGRLVETYKPRGWLADAGLRSVGMATEPTRLHPLGFALACWLDRIMVQVIECLDPPDWAGAAMLCPVPKSHWSIDPVALGRGLGAATLPWAELRLDIAAGRMGQIAVTPAWAGWMDDPMFARWCVGYFPELEDLRADLAFLAPGALVARVETTIAAAYIQYAADQESRSESTDRPSNLPSTIDRG